MAVPIWRDEGFFYYKGKQEQTTRGEIFSWTASSLFDRKKKEKWLKILKSLTTRFSTCVAARSWRLAQNCYTHRTQITFFLPSKEIFCNEKEKRILSELNSGPNLPNLFSFLFSLRSYHSQRFLDKYMIISVFHLDYSNENGG